MVHELSEREIQVVTLIAGGLMDAEIAARLGISTRTVQSHVRRAMEKTGTSTRTHLAVTAVRRGLLPEDA